MLRSVGSSGDPLIERKAGDAPTRDGDVVTAVVGTNHEVHVQRGQTLGLEVSFSGDGPFEIGWTRDGRPVSTEIASSPYTLNLSDFRRNMAGIYVVTVSTIAGSDTEQIEVKYDVPGK